MEAIDQIRHRIDGLRDDLLDLHKMAAEVINEDPDGSTLCVGNIIEVKSAVLERDIRDSRLNR